MEKKDLIEILLGIDEEVTLLLGGSSYRPTVIIVGGAAFLLKDFTKRRVTYDIDILSVDTVVRPVILAYPEANQSVSAYMDQIPYNFEDRLIELNIGARSVRFVTPSLEDLIVMKLYAQRPNDVQDIKSAAEADLIDWDLLEHLVYDNNEAKAAMNIERRYKEMVDAFERFKEVWKSESHL